MTGVLKSSGLGGFLLDVYGKLLADISSRIPDIAAQLERDERTLRERVSSEGIQVLTMVLPKLGKALESGLECGRYNPVTGVKSAKNVLYPLLFCSLWGRVFSEDGILLPAPCCQSIKYLRQLLYLAYKIDIPYPIEKQLGVIQAFEKVEEEDLAQPITTNAEVMWRASAILDSALRGLDLREIEPRHGNGAVASGEKLEDKWRFRHKYSDLHQAYPYYDYLMVRNSGQDVLGQVDWYRSLKPLDYGTAKVVLVPKDSRGPRLISMEPLEKQYIQQGQLKALVRHIESNKLTGGRVNFTSQEVNRRLAQLGSETRYWATLDLSEASDRVSCKLIEQIWPETALRYLFASRSSCTQLPQWAGGRTVILKKFAPMGSAVCFPVEALTFWALCVSAIETADPSTSADSLVYVYGDDIIVPVEYVDVVREVLEGSLLKVNQSKSFSQGYFRESCGMDAYQGVDVTPVRFKKTWSDQPTALRYVAFCDQAAQFWQRGYRRTAEYVWDRLKDVYGFVPYATSTAYFPCRIDCSSEAEARELNFEGGLRYRWNLCLQRTEVQVLTTKGSSRRSRLHHWPRLLCALLTSNPEIDMSVVALPRSAQLSMQWRPAPAR